MALEVKGCRVLGKGGREGRAGRRLEEQELFFGEVEDHVHVWGASGGKQRRGVWRGNRGPELGDGTANPQDSPALQNGVGAPQNTPGDQLCTATNTHMHIHTKTSQIGKKRTGQD